MRVSTKLKIKLPFVSRKEYELLDRRYTTVVIERNKAQAELTKYMVNEVTNENYLPLKVAYEHLREDHQKLLREYDKLKEKENGK